MKPFNLKEYLANPSCKIVTRDGRSVRIICTNAIGNYPVIGLILCNDGREYADSFNENGRWSDAAERNHDLFFSEQEHIDLPLTPEKNKKFDPKTLKPFDYVLTRNNKREVWRTNLFSHIGKDPKYKFDCNGCFRYCIPYNDETKNFVGTKGEAPEYYRYWED